MTAKHPRPRTAAVAAPTQKSGTFALKPWQTELIACVAIYLAVLVMFNEIAIQNKVFSKGDDTESAASLNTFAIEEAREREYPMWCPYIFAGFPSLAAGAYSNYEFMGMPYALANRFLSPRYWADVITIRGLFFGGADEEVHSARWILALMLYGALFMYLLMRRLDFAPLISFLSALIMAWHPYLISLATAAHGGKLMTFIYMPLIILAAWNVISRRRWFDMSLLAVALGWQIAVGGHTQILFYSFVTIGILYLVWAIMELKERASLLVLKPALQISIATLLGFGVGALWYIPLFKYVGYSIRGMGPAIATANTPSGYTLADATMWSFAPSELITFIVPSWFGLKSPYYWGDMPFTSSSFYFGVVPLLFAVLAFFGKRDRLFWGLTALSGFSILLSFGSHFEPFYALFFNYLPFFNKFRTPSLILLLVSLTGIIFAGYGLRFVLNLTLTDKWRKAFLFGAVASGGILILVLVSGNALSGLFGSYAKPNEAAQYSPQQLAQLRDIRFSMLRTDLMLAMLFLGLALAACYLKITGKIKSTALVAMVLAITAIDLWRFSVKFFDPQPAGSNVDTLRPNRIVETLKQDKSVYRVFPVGRLMQDNRWAAWEIPSFGGYHGAKMRSYQDLIDQVLFKSADPRVPLNMPFLEAMNCKYLVAEGQLPPDMRLELLAQDPSVKWILYRDPKALERAYFADSVIVISDRAETFRRITAPDFLWDYMAVVDKPIPGKVTPHPDRTARVTDYTPHHVRLAVSTPTPGLMVFSDAYYEPGWEALDNGTPTTIYLVNGFSRGIYLSAGTHTVEFKYAGRSEKQGIAVATISHFLVWGLLAGTFLWWKRRNQVKIH